MKIKNIKYALGFILQWLLLFLFLFFSISYNNYVVAQDNQWWVSEDEEECEDDEDCEIDEEESEDVEWNNSCTEYWNNWYYDPYLLTCLECTRPLINDSCESYVWNRFVNDLWTCCEEWDSCSNPSENWVCPEWFSDVAWCCQPVCGWNTYLPEWSASMNDCIACGSWTVPNANHTKCVCDPNKKCCWIQLNTVVPFIWDCIEMDADSSRTDTTSVNSVTAFPILVQWLMKILMSAIMVFSFLMVIVAWLSMITWAFSSSGFTKWKTILKNVIISLILLWCSWLILSLINPSFFGG